MPNTQSTSFAAICRSNWRLRSRFVVFDTELSDAQQLLSLWQTWRADPNRPQQLHYLALCPAPLSRIELAHCHTAWPYWHALSTELCAIWPPPINGFHRLLLEDGQIVLTLMYADNATCLQQVDAKVDAFYINGTTIEKWPSPLFARLGRLATAQATLDITLSDEKVQRTLEQIGFVFEKSTSVATINTLHARFSPRWQAASSTTSGTITPLETRQAIVIGAGLAGATICHRLSQRKWRLTLIEQHNDIAQAASGNHAGIFMPLLSKDDNPTTRLIRSAYLFALHVWHNLGGIGTAFTGATCGVLQIARDTEHAIAQLAQQARYPNEYAQWLNQHTVSALLNTTVHHGGWLFPGAGWIHPYSLCQALLNTCGKQVHIHLKQQAHALERHPHGWIVRDQHGTEIARAPIVILANGTGALTFPQTSTLPLTAIRGQITYLDPACKPAISTVVCGDAYLTPVINDLYHIGASYDNDDEPALRQDSQHENLMRLAKILPKLYSKTDAATLPLAGRVGFRCISADRLPLVGALPNPNAVSTLREPQLQDMPRLPDLYCLLGYASRGLIWAPLAAELLVAQLEGEPLPIETELAAALDPARFLLKAQRRNSTGKN